MFNKIHKNQIVIYVIAIILVFIGYLNYTQKDAIEIASKENITRDDNTIGDAVLVSNNENNNKKESNFIIVDQKGKNEEEEKEKNNEIGTNNNINKKENQKSDDYYANSKLQREQMYSQMIENYQKLINNLNVSEEQKGIATTEIKKINDMKNSIMICENLISTKGFEDSVIFANDGAIEIVVKSGDLTKEQVAQIQNIVTRQFNVKAENIHIMIK